MKKYLCILAGAALFVACEQKTETAKKKKKTPLLLAWPPPLRGKKKKTQTRHSDSGENGEQHHDREPIARGRRFIVFEQFDHDYQTGQHAFYEHQHEHGHDDD